MKKIPLRSVVWNFTKEWLLPKAGAAWAIYQVAKLGVGSAFDSSDPINALKPYLAIVHKVSDTKYIVFGIVIGVLFLAVNVAKFVSLFKRPVRFWFKFSRLGNWANIGVSVILGTLLLPMTLWLTALIRLPDNNREMLYFVICAAIYVVTNLIIYHNKMDDYNDSSGAIFWSVQLKLNQNEGDVLAALQKHFEELVWIGDGEILSNSKDGHMLIEMPILYDMSKWSKSDLDKFMALYKESTQILKDSGFEVISKSQSTAVKNYALKNIKREKGKR